MAAIRVLIAEDQAIVRAGLKLLIQSQPDLQVVAEVDSVRALLPRASSLAPDVVCLDLDLADGSGLKAVAPLRAACPGAKILVLTIHNDTSYVHAALAEGVNGYVAKNAAEEELLSAIRAVHHHRIVVNLALPSGAATAVPQAVPAGLASLSPREREVLELLALGFTNQQVADRVFLSVKTVETHRARLVAKLGLRDRADLMRYAIETGLLPAAGACARDAD